MPPLLCLLIDDDPDDREIFAMALEEADKSCNYLTATKAEEALRMLKTDLSFLPDFVFLDLNMPLMDGKECLREIKKLQHLSHVPIIIYSTSSYEKDVEDTRKLGATYFLTKPSSISALTKSLKEIFIQQNLPFLLTS